MAKPLLVAMDLSKSSPENIGETEVTTGRDGNLPMYSFIDEQNEGGPSTGDGLKRRGTGR
jgi:hypothetical protein